MEAGDPLVPVEQQVALAVAADRGLPPLSGQGDDPLVAVRVPVDHEGVAGALRLDPPRELDGRREVWARTRGIHCAPDDRKAARAPPQAPRHGMA